MLPYYNLKTLLYFITSQTVLKRSAAGPCLTCGRIVAYLTLVRPFLCNTVSLYTLNSLVNLLVCSHDVGGSFVFESRPQAWRQTSNVPVSPILALTLHISNIKPLFLEFNNARSST